MYRILVVEDDPIIAQVIQDELASWGYIVKRVADFERVMDLFSSFDPHLVLLDLMLPRFNGFHWCGEIRKISQLPVIFVSSASDNLNMVTALYQGADDFLVKPFDLSVLAAKVQALLRRSYDFAAPAEIVAYKNYILELKDNCIYIDGARTELTKNEQRILELLFARRGETVPRDAIMRRLWDNESFVDDNTLTVNVNRLRRKLEHAGLKDFITTQKGVGYYVQE